MKKRLLRVHQTQSLVLLIFLFFSGCVVHESSIPDYPVHMERDIYAINLVSPGSSYITDNKIVTEAYGYGGILIACTWDGQYCAFDLACPVEADRNIKVSKTDQDLIFKCETCGEEYDLGFGDGTPTKKISKEALKPYSANLNASNNHIIVTR